MVYGIDIGSITVVYTKILAALDIQRRRLITQTYLQKWFVETALFFKWLAGHNKRIIKTEL